MKLNLIIEIDLSEKDTLFSENELLEILNKRLDINKTDNIKILSAGIIDAVTISECDLPNNLIKCLHENRISYLYDLQRFRYFQIYDILDKDFFNGEYKELLCSTMKEYGVNFFDIDIDSLIPINDCGLQARIVTSLTRRGFVFLQDLTHFTRNQVLKTRCFGEKSQKELEEKLIEYGLWYADEKYN